MVVYLDRKLGKNGRDRYYTAGEGNKTCNSLLPIKIKHKFNVILLFQDDQVTDTKGLPFSGPQTFDDLEASEDLYTKYKVDPSVF